MLSFAFVDVFILVVIENEFHVKVEGGRGAVKNCFF